MAFIPSIPTPLRTSHSVRSVSYSRTPRLNVVAKYDSANVERREISRRALLVTLATITATKATSLLSANGAEGGVTASGLGYTVVKKGSGPPAQVGDLVGIRFKGSYNGVVFDNLFDATTPYFYRVGSDNILKVRHPSSNPRRYIKRHAYSRSI